MSERSNPVAFAGGRFRVRRQLGVGGSGVVYEVDDQQWGEVLALKLLRLAEPNLLHRFKKEFRALVDLAHPNLVRLHELFAREGRWFFTMERIDGEDLISHVRGADETVDLGRLRVTMCELVEGVAALHREGKLHRDLKPSNVLVTKAGRVKICDAGLVTATDEDLQTRSQHARGTPIFMSPEQAANRPLSPASDWYSVGVMLYLALTGRAPFSGSHMIVMRDKQLLDPPAPTELADVPIELDTLCRQLLQRGPERRPGAEEILAALSSVRRPPSRARNEAAPVSMRALDVLEAALARPDANVVIVRGEPGAGKTTLLERFGERALAHGALVLAGRVREVESIPYQAVDAIVDALGSTLKATPRDALEAMVPADLAALARLFPTLKRVETVSKVSEAAPGLDGDSLEAAASSLRVLLSRLSERRRIVLWIDDIDRADAESARLLQCLREGMDQPPFMLVGSLSADALSGAWADALGQAEISWLDLEPRAIEEHAKERAEILAGLSPDACTLLRLLAVAEEPLPPTKLGASARGLVTAAQSAWTELRRLRLVRRMGEVVTIGDEQVRSQVLASLTRLELDGCRRRLARPLSEPL
jgi:hypothetical protein